MKIGVFGGAFDPIHNGHLHLAREFARRLSLDKVLLIPTSLPPHKPHAYMAPPQLRLMMCRLAVGEDGLFEVSDIEIRREGASFTADTLNEVLKIYPGAELYLITGADMFLTLGTWNRFEEIARLATLCAAPRGDGDSQRLKSYAKTLEQRGAKCVIEDIPLMDVSSTAIREKILAGESIDRLVPAPIEEYIKKFGLYKTAPGGPGYSDSQFIEIIRGRLSPKRFKHSLAVAEQAKRLATLYGADPKKAYTAGILHDIMKDAGAEAQLQIIGDFGIILDNVEKNLPGCWHAIAGAVFIEHILGITDRDLINAVRYHTTGRAGMSPLEVTIYLADFTSADRDFPGADEMRRLAETGIRPAMKYGLSFVLRELIDKPSVIHPDSIHAYNETVLAGGEGGAENSEEQKKN